VRRKGELSKVMVDQGWPHQVAVLANVESARFDEVLAAREELGACVRGHTFVSEGEFWNVTCFATAENAAEYQARFGGMPFDRNDRSADKPWARWYSGRRKG